MCNILWHLLLIVLTVCYIYCWLYLLLVVFYFWLCLLLLFFGFGVSCYSWLYLRLVVFALACILPVFMVLAVFSGCLQLAAFIAGCIYACINADSIFGGVYLPLFVLTVGCVCILFAFFYHRLYLLFYDFNVTF